MGACPTLTGPNVTGMVNDSFMIIEGMIQQYKAMATGLITDLTSAPTPNPVGFAVTYDIPAGLMQPFVAPAVPVAPDVNLDTSLLTDPGEPPSISVDEASFDPTPGFTATPRPAIGKYNPGQLNATPPDLSFTQTAVDEPDALAIENPDEPTLHEIVLPTMPDLPPIPTFNGVAPTVDFVAPDGNLNFETHAYASTLLTQIKSRLATMLSGQVGLPIAIEQALFGRARDREDTIKRQSIREAKEDAANMGHTLPPGSLMAHIAATRQTAMDNASQSNREITIEIAKSDREFLHRAIEKGIALEGELINADIRMQELDLQAATTQVRVAIDVFNANVTLFNARGQLYGVEAQVFRDRIAAENLLLDRVRAQIEIQRLVGEVNKDLLAFYDARLRARNLLIEQFTARWNAIKIITERDTQRLEQKRLLLQQYDSTIGAWEKQWDVVLKQYEVDAANGRLFESQANAQVARINAVAAGNRNKIDQKRLTLDVQLGNLTAWRGKLDRFQGELQRAVELVRAQLGTFEGKARIYAASGEVARSQNEANSRSVQVLLESLHSKALIMVENVKMQIQQFLSIMQDKTERVRAAGQFATQLAAGATSALNVSASAHESNSISNSVSCSTSFSGSADE